MVRWALNSGEVAGPLNVTAPNPVTNAEFTGALAAAMHRPALFPVPAFVLRGMLGREMADALLLEGQRALPAKAQTSGFTFRYPAVDDALAAIYA
jgi:NAD dependent epimerase/dehydratase family enzyme